MIKCKGGRRAVGAGWALKDSITVDSGAGGAADVGTEGVVERDRVSFTEIRGVAVAASAVAPKTDFACS